MFLVPSDWFKRDKLRQDFQTLQSIRADVGTSVVTWDEVVKMIDEHAHAFDKGNLFVEEFQKELVEWVGHKPSDFNREKLERLDQVVDGIQRASKTKGFDTRRERHTSRKYGLVNGLNFLNLAGKDAFWFGVWEFFWKQRGILLCFAVEDSWGKEVYEAFRATYEGSPIPFSRSTVGVIDNQVLDRPDDVVSAIWSIIEPIVQATVTARR